MKINTDLRAKRIILKLIVFLIILICFFISVDLCAPEELDPENREGNEVLYIVNDALDKNEINVYYKHNKNVDNNKKPMLTRLENLPLELDNARFNRIINTMENPWMADFMKGVGFCLIRESAKNHKEKWQNASKRENSDKLLMLWKNIDADKRIFLSFTSEDYPIAKIIADAYEQKGFLVFLYMKDKMKRTFPPDMTGFFFESAGPRLVIDSNIARRSTGIYFEYRINYYETKKGEYLFKRREDKNVDPPIDTLGDLENAVPLNEKETLTRSEFLQKDLEKVKIKNIMELSGEINSNTPPELIEEKVETEIEYLNKNEDLFIDRFKRSLKFKK